MDLSRLNLQMEIHFFESLFLGGREVGELIATVRLYVHV